VNAVQFWRRVSSTELSAPASSKRSLAGRVGLEGSSQSLVRRVFDHLFAGIPVSDRQAAGEWYERLLGRPPDLIPNAREAAWRLTDSGWLVIERDPARAGSALHTLLVADLDGFLAGLAERGVRAGPVELIGDGVRQAIVSDPDGNRLKVGQPPG